MTKPPVDDGNALRSRVLVSALVVCSVLTGLVWHSRGPAGWERPIIFLLSHVPLPMARVLVLFWQPTPFAVATLCLAWIATRSGRVQLALSGAAGCFLAAAVTEHLLKPLVNRHALHSGSPVFPSGHVTTAAAWAMLAWLVLSPRVQIRSALIVVHVLMSWAVISTRDHYPADAIAGLLLGGLVVYGVVRATAYLTAALTDLARVEASDPLAHTASPAQS